MAAGCWWVSAAFSYSFFFRGEEEITLFYVTWKKKLHNTDRRAFEHWNWMAFQISSSRSSVVVVVRLKFLSASSGNMRTFSSRVVNRRRVCNRKAIHSVLEKSVHWMGKIEINWEFVTRRHGELTPINYLLFSIITFHSEHWAAMLRCHASFPYVFAAYFKREAQ